MSSGRTAIPEEVRASGLVPGEADGESMASEALAASGHPGAVVA
jgi:hypothetical protein